MLAVFWKVEDSSRATVRKLLVQDLRCGVVDFQDSTRVEVSIVLRKGCNAVLTLTMPRVSPIKMQAIGVGFTSEAADSKL